MQPNKLIFIPHYQWTGTTNYLAGIKKHCAGNAKQQYLASGGYLCLKAMFSFYVAFKIQPLLFHLWLYEASADMELCAHRGRLRHGGLLGNDKLCLSPPFSTSSELSHVKRETRCRSSTQPLKLTKLALLHLNVATQSGRTISQLAPWKVHLRVMLIEAGWRHQAGLERPTTTPTATAEKRGAQSHNMISSINRLHTTGFNVAMCTQSSCLSSLLADFKTAMWSFAGGSSTGKV